MRQCEQVSEAVYGDMGDLGSMEDALDGVTRAIIFVSDDYRFDDERHAEFANGISLFEAAKNKNLSRIILVSKVSGSGSLQEYSM